MFIPAGSTNSHMLGKGRIAAEADQVNGGSNATKNVQTSQGVAPGSLMLNLLTTNPGLNEMHFASIF